MTIEAEVQALTVATTDLLEAVNIGKQNLDAAENAAAASATTATTQAGTATTQAGIATTQAGIATTQAGIATTQANNAVAVVTGGTASLTAAAGRIPIADANAELDASWLIRIANNAYPTIRPTLDLDFINGATVDPRITFTRASTTTFYDGKTFAKAEENLLLNSATLATQNVATTAQPYTLSFEGTGTVTLSGTSTAGPLVGSTGRVTLTFTPTAGTLTLTVTGTVSNAQLEARSQVTAYTPTTTQPITRYQPVLLTAPANTAVIDHDPVTGARLGLRVWEARTNLLLWSRDLTNAAWVKTNATAALNAIGLDGVVNSASTITATAANATVLQSITSASAARSTAAAVKRRAGVGVIEMTQDGGTTWTPVTVTSAWTRVGPVSATVTNPIVGFRIATSGDAIEVDYTQCENGNSASPYIPTTTAQVTRAADAASMTGANFSSWYRAGEGTIYTEASSVAPAATAQVFGISDGTASNRIVHGSSATNSLFVAVNGAIQADLFTAVVASNAASKTAAAFAVNDLSMSRSGGTPATDTSALLPVVDRMFIGDGAIGSGATLNGHIRHITYYPARLSNATLQAITKP